MKKIEKLKNIIDSIDEDVDKFWNKKNGAAGARIRKEMQEIKNLAQEIRVEVQKVKNEAK